MRVEWSELTAWPVQNGSQPQEAITSNRVMAAGAAVTSLAEKSMRLARSQGASEGVSDSQHSQAVHHVLYLCRCGPAGTVSQEGPMAVGQRQLMMLPVQNGRKLHITHPWGVPVTRATNTVRVACTAFHARRVHSVTEQPALLTSRHGPQP